MKRAIILHGTMILLAAGTLAAADSPNTDPGSEDLYRGNELSLDGFGSAALGQQTLDHLTRRRINQDARLGAGAGLNYFITRNLGVGADAYTENTAHRLIDNVSGNLILRLPLGESGVAPYIFGGGGHKFDPVEANFGQAGAGLEIRFTPHFGIFADGRYVFPNKIRDYGLARAGFRVAF